MILGLLLGVPAMALVVAIVFSGLLGLGRRTAAPGGPSSSLTQPAAAAKPLTGEEFVKALDELKTADAQRKEKLAESLQLTRPADVMKVALEKSAAPGGKEADKAGFEMQVRRQINAALTPLLKEGKGAKIAAARALGVWGTTACVPAMAAVLEADTDDSDVREAVIDALARCKKGETSKRGIKAVVARIKDPWDRSMPYFQKAIKGFGDDAEPFVQEYVDNPDRDVRLTAYSLLKTIGTERCLGFLEKAQEDRAGDPGEKEAIEETLKAVRARVTAP
jgi:hypothetical protein